MQEQKVKIAKQIRKKDITVEKKNIDWENLDFGYRQTDKRFVANYKDGAWDEGTLTEDATIVLNECAGVLCTDCF